MSDIPLPEDKKYEYMSLMKSARDIESTIGNVQYRLYKFLNLRQDIDTSLKVWWDKTLKDLELDPKKDYQVNNEGTITEINKPTPAKTEACDCKPQTVEDLK